MEWLRQLAGLLGRKDSGTPAAPPKAPEAAPVVEDWSEADEIVRQICTEFVAAARDSHDRVVLSISPRWIALKRERPDLQVAIAWAVYRSLADRDPLHFWTRDTECRAAILVHSLQRHLPFRPEQLHALLRHCLEDYSKFRRLCPASVLLGAVERLAGGQPLPAEMGAALNGIAKLFRSSNRGFFMAKGEARRLTGRIERLLDPPTTEKLPDGAFTDQMREWIAGLDGDEREPWLKLALLGAESRGKSKPGTQWLKRAKQTIESIGLPRVATRMQERLDIVTVTISDDSDDILKGLIWATTLLDHSVIAGDVGRFGAFCFGPSTYFRTVSYKLGNAAVWALSQMVGEPRAAAELFGLRQMAKQHAARKTIDAGLVALAEKSGTTIEEMEDHSLPSFELDSRSRRTFHFGDTRGDLSVEVLGITQQWSNSTGKPVKSPPAEVREEFADDLADYRQLAKDIEAARKTQVLRLEQAWVEERSWSFSAWQTQFREHPLRRPMVGALIWLIDDKAVMLEADALVDVSGTACVFGPDSPVSLWHPLNSDPRDVLAWRVRILERGVTQPIKQAHREIYVLTDAERATRTYSNRFAAHILSQYQLRALCDARAWRFKLMGEWDGHNVPTRMLRKLRMTVEYRVDMPEGVATSFAHVALSLTSDQVRFLDAENQPVELERIPPIVFSEVLRDVDLFVAVTSVANDPNWTDGGPDGQNRAYWQEMAGAELGQSAATRRELISWISPKLSIADKLEITDKCLVVQGKLQKYAIHFGSSNVQILPSNRNLCIVPAGAPREARDIKLPFEGDTLFSTILSKAFLLVDESRIKDKSILRQLGTD